MAKEDGRTELARDEHWDLHYYMVLTRKLEERMGALFRQGKITGGLYRSTGQEGGAVGTAYALEDRDWIAPMIRDLGSSMVRGIAPYDVLSQFMARGDSPTRGRDGNLHFGSLARRQLAPISHLGTNIAVLAGALLAARMKGEDDLVGMAYIGDGATSTGSFHEGMNFLGVQRLPMVVVGEANKWAYSTPTALQYGCARLEDRAAAYGIATMSVDGNDVEEVLLASRRAVDHARSGEGPIFLVLDTFRICGHAEHDDAGYVPPEEMKRWKARDPIDLHRGRLLDQDILTRAELADLAKQATGEVEAAADRALVAPDADPATVSRFVYFEPGDDRDGPAPGGG